MESLIVSILFFLVKVNILEIDRFKLDINPISPVYWVDSESIFINEKEISYLYNVVNREVIEEYVRGENQLWGYDRGDLFTCFWENRDIDSPDEYSTHLRVERSDREVVFDIELRPTVVVVECGAGSLLRTVFPIEERYFSFEDELYEVESYDLDMLSPKFKRLLSRDSLGNYWVTEFLRNW